jgi:hypothetical protein
VSVTHVGTRRAFAAGITADPTSSWVAQPARHGSRQGAEWGLRASHVRIEHDPKSTDEFGALLAADGCKAQRIAPPAPDPNAPAEWLPSPCAASCSPDPLYSASPKRHRKPGEPAVNECEVIAL